MLKKSMMLTMVVVLAMVASVQADNFFQAPDGVEYADWVRCFTLSTPNPTQ